MGYEVSDINHEGWIFIYHEDSIYEIDSFVKLLKGIQNEIGGNIIQVKKEEYLYRLENYRMNLLFQWDSCFGNVVIVKEKKNIEKAVKLLKKHCEKLNLMENDTN